MKREEYQNRRIIDLFAAKLHNSPIYYIALYRGFNTEKQKGKMKKINVTVADITTLQWRLGKWGYRFAIASLLRRPSVYR